MVIKSQISLSESQRGAGLSGQALVPPAVAHREKAAILRCPDLQTVVLCEPHWGESVTVKISYVAPIGNSGMSVPAPTRAYSPQLVSSEPSVQSFTESHCTVLLEHLSSMNTGGFSYPWLSSSSRRDATASRVPNCTVVGNMTNSVFIDAWHGAALCTLATIFISI